MFGTGLLRRGSSSTGVEELQQWLIDRGFLVAHSAPTGTFDTATEEAVKAFQMSAGIGVDGEVGSGTRTAAGSFVGQAEDHGWHPTATRDVQVTRAGGAYTTTTRRGVLHTTETNRLPSYDSPPHFTIGRNGTGQPVSVWQHFPITIAARALRHPSGTVQTNRHGAIQIEIIGHARNSATLATADPDLFTGLAALMRWIEGAGPVAAVARHPFADDAAFGLNGSVRLSDADWTATEGWVGHQHVPHNTHWDPGELDVTALLPGATAGITAPAAQSLRHALGDAPAPGPVARPSIRATNRRLTNAFPSLTFTVDAAGHPYFDVLLSTDRRLFAPEARAERTAGNFYAARQDGLRDADRAQGRYVAPVAVIREFADANPDGCQVYYTVVGHADAQGGGAVPAAEPSALAVSAPAVALIPGFTGPTMSEPMGLPLSMLRAARPAMAAGRPRGHAFEAAPVGAPPARAAALTEEEDQAEGEDGYDFRMTTRPDIPDYPPVPPGDDEDGGDGDTGAAVAAPPPPPSAAPEPPVAAPESLGYDDGWDSWATDEAPTAGLQPPAFLHGVETPRPGEGEYDDEYDDLRWAGSSYGSSFGEKAPAAADPGSPPPADGSPPTSGDRAELSPDQKRDVVEAYVGGDDELYSAVNPDGEFAGTAGTDHPAYQRYHLGLSYGIVGFSQDVGDLGQLLTLMSRRDAATFGSVFGDAAAELLEVTNRPGPRSSESPEGRSVRVQPVAGADLWEEPWLGRFTAAGRERTFRGAQIELASALYLDPMLRFAADLGIFTQRGLAMLFDRAAHRGVPGGRAWVVETVGPLQTPVLVEEVVRALGIPDVESFQRSQPHLLVDDQFGPLTHAAMTAALRGLVARTGRAPVPLMSYQQMVDAMVQRAAGQPWGDRIVRLSRDGAVRDDPLGEDTA